MKFLIIIITLLISACSVAPKNNKIVSFPKFEYDDSKNLVGDKIILKLSKSSYTESVVILSFMYEPNIPLKKTLPVLTVESPPYKKKFLSEFKYCDPRAQKIRSCYVEYFVPIQYINRIQDLESVKFSLKFKEGEITGKIFPGKFMAPDKRI